MKDFKNKWLFSNGYNLLKSFELWKLENTMLRARGSSKQYRSFINSINLLTKINKEKKRIQNEM